MRYHQQNIQTVITWIKDIHIQSKASQNLKINEISIPFFALYTYVSLIHKRRYKYDKQYDPTHDALVSEWI